ncbi:MAG: YheU family protein [Steroidobacteraceae bacterium]
MNDSWEDPQERPEPVAVPHAELSAGALQGVIDNYILREGTDYGDRTFSHEQKVAQVLRQLERGEARILFDPLDSSVTIVALQPGRKRRQE